MSVDAVEYQALLAQGRIGEAEELLIAALGVSGLQQGTSGLLGTLWLGLSNTYLRCRTFKKAIRAATSAREAFGRAGTPSHEIASAITAAANAYHVNGMGHPRSADIAEARRLCAQALSMHDARGGTGCADGVAAAYGLTSVALESRAYAAAGRYRADATRRASTLIRQSPTSTANKDLAAELEVLGASICLASGRLEEAHVHLDRLLGDMSTGSLQQERRLTALRLKGEAFRRAGAVSGAKAALEAAMTVEGPRMGTAMVGPVWSPAEAAELRTSHRPLATYIDVIRGELPSDPGMRRRLLYWISRSRDAAVREVRARSRIERDGPANEGAEEFYPRLSRSLLAGSAFVDIVLDLGRDRYSAKGGPSRPAYLAMSVRAGQLAPVIRELGSRDHIDRMLATHAVRIRLGLPAGPELLERISVPLLALIRDAEWVAVAGDGPWQFFPLAAMPEPGGGTWLDHRMALFTGEAMSFVEASRRLTGTGEASVWAVPDAGSTMQGKIAYRSLAFAKREAEECAHALGTAPHSWTNGISARDWLPAVQASEAGTLHIACHADRFETLGSGRQAQREGFAPERLAALGAFDDPYDRTRLVLPGL